MPKDTKDCTDQELAERVAAGTQARAEIDRRLRAGTWDMNIAVLISGDEMATLSAVGYTAHR